LVKFLTMGSSLGQIKDWHARAQLVRYSASALARSCGVSLRQLERYFTQQGNPSPKTWLDELRDKRAIELLKESFSIKEVAAVLGYRTAAHFSSNFKKRHGVSPAAFARSVTDVSRFES
jgi:transcriptional regulator GlxA family with amidase domain